MSRTDSAVVIFDIGGVLEVGEVIDAGGHPPWLLDLAGRLGMTTAELDRRMAGVDPGGKAIVGGMTQADLRAGYAAALDLDDAAADDFMAHFWDWYCGEPNDTLFDYARRLAVDHRLAICSNSAPGAREQEERRYALSMIFDPIVYSHEVGLAKPDPRLFALITDLIGVPPERVIFIDDGPGHVAAARRFGWRAVRHLDDAATIRAVDALLG